MAKLPRILARQFAQNASPTDVGEFGSLKAGFPLTTLDPAVIQSLSNWLGGWKDAVFADNSPTIEDMNGFCLVVAYQIAYLMQAGIPEYDATTTYYKGSFCNSAGLIFVSIADNNLGNALTDDTKWSRPLSDIQTKSANYTMKLTDDVVEFDATAGDITVSLPAASATNKGKRFTIVRIDTMGAFTVFVAGTSFSSQLNSLYESMTVISNGAVWYKI